MDGVVISVLPLERYDPDEVDNVSDRSRVSVRSVPGA